jgi:hypothetical protein
MKIECDEKQAPCYATAMTGRRTPLQNVNKETKRTWERPEGWVYPMY